MSEHPSEQAPDVLGPAKKLANILSVDPKSLDQNTFRKGDRFLVIFEDKNYGSGFKNLPALKTSVIMEAIEDLSGRGKILSESYLGVIYSKNKVQTFRSAYGEAPEGSVVYKIGIKNVASFQNWRNGSVDEISQEDINAAIYRLAVEWSRLL